MLLSDCYIRLMIDYHSGINLAKLCIESCLFIGNKNHPPASTICDI